MIVEIRDVIGGNLFIDLSLQTKRINSIGKQSISARNA
jgi:hypothetical protein